MQLQTDDKKITFVCPKCKATLKVPLQLAGVSGPCPKCGGHIVAPRPGEPGRVNAQPAKQTSRENPDGKERNETSKPVAPASPPRDPQLETPSVSVQTAAPTAEQKVETVPPPEARPPRDPDPAPGPESISKPKPPPVEIEDLDSLSPAKVDSGQDIDDPGDLDRLQPLEKALEKQSPEETRDEVASRQETETPPTTEKEADLETQKENSETPAETPAPPELPKVTVSTIPPNTPSPSDTPPVTTPIGFGSKSKAPVAAPHPASPSRIERDARAKAQARSASNAHETRPISPVTNPGYLDDVQPATDQSPVANPGAPATVNSLPRLDVNLAESKTGSNLPPEKSPLPAPAKPTRINLPQLNEAAAAEPKTASQPQADLSPVTEAKPAPAYNPVQKVSLPDPQPQPQSEPQIENKALLNVAEDPNPASATTLPPVSEPQPQPDLGSEIPKKPGLGTVMFSEPAEAKPKESDIPPVQKPERNPIEKPAAKDEIFDTDSEFDDLFGPVPASVGAQKKNLGFRIAVIAAALVLSGVAVYFIGLAFGGFSVGPPDQAETDKGNSTGKGNSAVVENSKGGKSAQDDPQTGENPASNDNGTNITSNAKGKGTVENNGINGSPVPPSLGAPKAAGEPSLAGNGTENSVGGTPIESENTASSPNVAMPGENVGNSLVLADSGGKGNKSGKGDSGLPASAVVAAGGEVPAPPIPNYPGPAAPNTGSPLILPNTPGTVVPPRNDEIPDNVLTNINNTSAPGTGTEPGGETIGTPETVAITPPSGGTAASSKGYGPTGEFAPPPAAVSANVVGPPAPETFTTPTEGQLGDSRSLIETFLEAPNWRERLKYTYQAERVGSIMQTYYSTWPDEPLSQYALKFLEMESDPSIGGPYWVYMVRTNDSTEGFPIIVRKDGDLLKVDWEIFAEFSDEHYVKFKNGQIPGPRTFRLVMVRQSGYYGSDRDGFADRDNYQVYKIVPPYGDLDYEEVAFIPKSSPLAARAEKFLPLGMDPLAVMITIDYKAFPHGINHIVITDIVTDGWFPPSR
ncbi:MAG: hypothetical protein HKN23_07600 [Verrucomicrobiales bacterium]|nr:hypothetical protein [Verrucomicrobiales bacterium]